MALRSLLWSKPATPYFKPPPLHICVVKAMELPKVVSWQFDSDGARPEMTKVNMVAAISDGDSVVKMTVYEEFSDKFKEGVSYVVQGHALRGQSPPYLLNINKNTLFFRSAPINITEDIRQQAEALLTPHSPLTPLCTSRDADGLITVEGDVVELLALKKIQKMKETIPLRNITLQQGETQVPLCLWREAAVVDLKVGSHVSVSHVKATKSPYGVQLHSSGYTKIKEISKDQCKVVGALGVMDVPEDPGMLLLLLDNERKVLIKEEMWKPIEIEFTSPPVNRTKVDPCALVGRNIIFTTSSHLLSVTACHHFCCLCDSTAHDNAEEEQEVPSCKGTVAEGGQSDEPKLSYADAVKRDCVAAPYAHQVKPTGKSHEPCVPQVSSADMLKKVPQTNEPSVPLVSYADMVKKMPQTNGPCVPRVSYADMPEFC
ncbi:hypothetical protein F2P79_023497 [Pimephales promelas]|nr:hypothetical protein F2P79_023497 [Pimephales promelas]